MPDGFFGWITDYLEGELSGEERAKFEACLKSDPALVAQFRESLRIHGLLLGKFADVGDAAQVMAAVHEAQSVKSASSVMEIIKRDSVRKEEPVGAVDSSGSRAWVSLFGAVAAVLLVVSLGWILFNLEPATQPVVVGIIGRDASRSSGDGSSHSNAGSKVTLVRGTEFLLLKAGDPLFKGDLIKTAMDGRQMIKLVEVGGTGKPNSNIELTPNTHLTLDVSIQGGVQMRLDQGKIRCAVERQPKGKPLLIVTPDATATVVGTRFQLSVQDQQTRLEVREGAVALAEGGRAKKGHVKQKRRSVLVRAGHYCVAKKNKLAHDPKSLTDGRVKRKPVTLYGLISEEAITKGKRDRKSLVIYKYILTDRFGNRFVVAPIRWGKEVKRPRNTAPDFSEYVGKLVRLDGMGVVHKIWTRGRRAVRIDRLIVLTVKEWHKPLPEASGRTESDVDQAE